LLYELRFLTEVLPRLACLLTIMSERACRRFSRIMSIMDGFLLAGFSAGWFCSDFMLIK